MSAKYSITCSKLELLLDLENSGVRLTILSVLEYLNEHQPEFGILEYPASEHKVRQAIASLRASGFLSSTPFCGRRYQFTVSEQGKNLLRMMGRIDTPEVVC